MKWSIAGLAVLGVIAATCTAFLVASLRSSRSAVGGEEDAVRDVEILVAARDMPAITMVDGKSVVSKTVRADLAPEGYLSDPIQVAGGVLAVPVVEGQVFTAACFLNEGRIPPIPDGMRAFSLKLATYQAGLLYPGCLVDVLASFKIPSESGRPVSSRAEAISMPLLQRVQVLAIDDHTVLSEKRADNAPGVGSGAARPNHRIITLMVDSIQAEALQLATKYGNVSLALRNPGDDDPVDTDPITLKWVKDGQLGQVPVIGPPVADPQASTEDGSERAARAHVGRTWEVDVFHGPELEEKVFTLSENAVQTDRG